MRMLRKLWAPVLLSGLALFWVQDRHIAQVDEEQLWRHRNLGKAFYENPTTSTEAVEEFAKALKLAPNSSRERLNYALALLKLGKTKEAISELERLQKADPALPHTRFNLGITYKKEGDFDRSLQQFEQMVKLVPEEPISHYNLGVLYKMKGRLQDAIKHFQKSAELDPNLAAPHFQLYSTFRQLKRTEDAARELQIFQRVKKQNEGAAVPEDMDWSFYSEIYDVIEARPEPDSPPAELKFAANVLAGGGDAKTTRFAILDADGDQRPDLVTTSALGAALYRKGTDLTPDSGLESLKDVTAIAPGDFNNDGLADLCVLINGSPTLLANEKGRFRKIEAVLPAGPFVQALWLDFDHDYDLDLFLLGKKSALLRNQGAAGFADRTSDFPFVEGEATSGAAFRLIADTKGTDLLVSYKDRPGVMYRDWLAGKFRAEIVEALPPGAEALQAVDVDQDGWHDVLGNSGGILLLLNRQGKLERTDSPTGRHGPAIVADIENRGSADLVAGGDVLRSLGQGKFAEPHPVAGLAGWETVTSADFDGDGRVDLAAVNAVGRIALLFNRTETWNQWVSIGIQGVKNIKLAPEAEIEVKAGSRYQKKIYRGVPLLFGLRSHKQLDTVRITWPNALIQSEPEQKVAQALVYEEKQRLSGSCPLIFTWDGREFRFITDVLGVAPLGASGGEGSYFPVDHDEYVQIPAGSLVAADGSYEIRITEELREISYLDQIQLLAVDHPADVEVFTNEKWKSPPFPDFRLFGVRRKIRPVSARNHRGEDQLAAVLGQDDRYADGFQRKAAGVAETHQLILDFGPNAAPHNRAILVLNGWVDWADGSAFLNMAQQGRGGLRPPYLQVKDRSGEWRTVIEDMGIPSGKPKTIVVDLSRKFLSASREVRIVTNLCVLWNEIFLSEETEAAEARIRELPLKKAHLRFRGFSQNVVDPQRRRPEHFVYSKVGPASMWNPTPGLYTRYGDVAELVKAIDDRFVIMGAGDETQLLFDARALPAPPPGWKRAFLLKVDGWAKDGDLNTAFSQSVEPLPFHGMSRYPYPAGERYPDGPAHRAYREKYNTRPALRLIRPLAGARRPLSRQYAAADTGQAAAHTAPAVSE